MGYDSQDKVGQKLEKLSESKQPQASEPEELYYDPSTGELEVSSKNQLFPDPDRVPATVMAREGFF